MNFVVTALAAFLITTAIDTPIEVGAEISAGWSGEWLAHYFWNVEADPNGSEAQRLASELAARVPDREGFTELCTLHDRSRLMAEVRP